jgi:ribosomal protein S18 acetylase RimI-like enzyme
MGGACALDESERFASALVSLKTFSPAERPALVTFLNQALAGRRHWSPITEADFDARVTARPGFDAGGLILAWHGDRVVGGVSATRPTPESGTPGHHIAWLVVLPENRRRGIGSRLLQAAENYLYYCPVHFAAQIVPVYGDAEALRPRWSGLIGHMGVSALHDRELAAWLERRGYMPERPGDVSLRAGLHDRERPADPDLVARGLALANVSEWSPWIGADFGGGLHTWGDNSGRPYQGLVLTGDGRAVGSIVWYPLPDDETAALAWFGLESASRVSHFGAYLLDLALHRMARQGYLWVETRVRSTDQPEATALFRQRGFQVVNYWVNLVKT